MHHATSYDSLQDPTALHRMLSRPQNQKVHDLLALNLTGAHKPNATAVSTAGILTVLQQKLPIAARPDEKAERNPIIPQKGMKPTQWPKWRNSKLGALKERWSLMDVATTEVSPACRENLTQITQKTWRDEHGWTINHLHRNNHFRTKGACTERKPYALRVSHPKI